MRRDVKNTLVYGAFGLLLGVKIFDVLLYGGRLLDYYVLLIGLAAAVIHYLPDRGQAEPEDRLDLRDYPDTERGRGSTTDPEPRSHGLER